MLDFNISLTNVGNRTVEEIIVTIHVPQEIYIRDIPRKMKNIAKLMGIESTTDPVDGTEIYAISYKIDKINPGVAVVLSDFLILSGPTRHEREDDFDLKDGRARVRWQLLGAWGIHFTINARDMPAAKRDFRLWSLKPEDELVKNKEDVTGAYGVLKANPGSAYGARSAVLFVVKEPERTSLDIPGGPEFLFASQVNATKYKGSYFPGIGFLPLHNQADV